jgi:DNA modification methylase
MEQLRVDLRLGDCLEVMTSLPGSSIDLIVTDPPYGKMFHDSSHTRGDSNLYKNPAPARFAGCKIAGDARPDIARLLRPCGAAYIFSQWMVESAWIDALKASGLKVRNRLIWVKPMHGMGDTKTTFGPKHEAILYAARGRHLLRGRREGDVWLQPSGTDGCFAGRKGKSHPNQKPIDLVRWLIEKSSEEGDTILDPFMGSGTTGVACVSTRRRFIGIETHEPYFRIAERRIHSAQPPLAIVC